MTINREVEFNNIVSDILKNDKFIELKYEIHHGISRLEHSLNVAKTTFLLCKKFHMKNLEEITRAALLHDFYTSNEIGKNAFVSHPMKACENAVKYFGVNKNQQNIIATHMFPLCKHIPKSSGGYIVSTADKIVALYECAKYKAPLQFGAILLFAINFISIQR